MVRYTSGYICVAVTEADADRLDLPPMFRVNQDRRGTAYTVTVDAREGVTTGISASDRAHTIRTARRRRDHVGRPRPARATSCRCAPRTAACCAGPATPRPPSTSPCSPGCARPGTLCEIVSEKDPTGMARGEELRVFADEHDLVHDLDRRPDRLPQALRQAGRAGGRGDRPADARHLHRRRLPQLLRQPRARRLRLRRHRRRRGRAGPRALRVPHRRRLRLAALRLRPPAAGRAGRRRPGGARRRALHPRPRGPRHRPAAQAAGLPAAGRRAPTPSTPTSTSACPPTPATTAPARRSWSTSACTRCGC